MRIVLREPITVTMAGETIVGTMRFKAHERQSYDLILEMGRNQGVYDLKEPYYRQLVHSYDPSMVDGRAGGIGASSVATKQGGRLYGGGRHDASIAWRGDVGGCRRP